MKKVSKIGISVCVLALSIGVIGCKKAFKEKVNK